MTDTIPTHEQIHANSDALLASARELVYGMYELTRLLHLMAKDKPHRKRRCGAPTSLNRPCRGKPEPGQLRCARHLDHGLKKGPETPEELLDLAMTLSLRPSMRLQPKGEESVGHSEGSGEAAPSKRARPECGAKLCDGARCRDPLEPGQFRCPLHAAEMRARRTGDARRVRRDGKAPVADGNAGSSPPPATNLADIPPARGGKGVSPDSEVPACARE